MISSNTPEGLCRVHTPPLCGQRFHHAPCPGLFVLREATRGSGSKMRSQFKEDIFTDNKEMLAKRAAKNQITIPPKNPTILEIIDELRKKADFR
ncbi:MAG: hypothetical protein JRI36_09330 [Deltaproteobacteria bacterium]|nr:hypothetical protein [Deltaproteobacteria bacterium]